MSQKKKSSSKETAYAELNRLAEEIRPDEEFWEREAKEKALNEASSFGFVKDEPEDQLGVRLREARENDRLTQGELADRTKLADKENIGITRNVISFIESGRTKPGPREIRLLCEALRISPNFLIYGNDDPFDNRTELSRYGGYARTEVEFHAYIAYCVSRLHHHHKTSLIDLLMGLLRGWNKDFDTELHQKAIPTFIQAAKELEALEETRKKSKT